MAYNIYTKDKDGVHLVHSNATYAETELYRAQSVNIEVFELGADPYEEGRAKALQRNQDAEREAKMIAHRDYCLAMTDY